GQVELSSSGGPDVEELNWDLQAGDLKSGWNIVKLYFKNAKENKGAGNNSINLTAINFFRVYKPLNSGASITARIDNMHFSHDPLPTGYTPFDNCESISGWQTNVNGNILTLDNSEFKEGLGSISTTGTANL